MNCARVVVLAPLAHLLDYFEPAQKERRRCDSDILHHSHFINQRVAIALQTTKTSSCYLCDPVLAIFDHQPYNLLSPLHPAQTPQPHTAFETRQPPTLVQTTPRRCSSLHRSTAHPASIRAQLPTYQRRPCYHRPLQPANRSTAPTCTAPAAHCKPSSPATSRP